MQLHRVFPVIVVLAIATGLRADDSPKNESAPVHISIDANKAGAPINPFIYGQFIEHLGRSIYGGIWAEMLEDRKFYYPITDEYRPYGDSKGTDFPIVSASPWQVVGKPGTVTMVKENAFVGEHSPQIAAGSGIQQNDLAFIAGQKYVGYLRLRAADEESKVKVTIVCGDTSWVSEFPEIRVTGKEFQEYPLRFRATGTTDHARLVVSVSDKPCFVGTVSLMPADNIRGMRADTLALLKQLHGTIYRWPGGNFVSGYNWRDGIGPRDRRPPRKNPAWSGVEHNDFGIDEFVDLCHEIDAEPLIAVNTGFGDDYSAAQEVEYANGSKDTIGGLWRVENGHDQPYGVKYWCAGNEMFGPWQLGYMQLGHYVQKHNRVVAAMHKVDPSLTVVGSGDLNTQETLDNRGQKRTISWSQGMLEACGDSMNLISEHFYCHGNPNDVPAHVAEMVDAIRAKAEQHRKLQPQLKVLHGRTVPIALDEWNYWFNDYQYGDLGCPYHLRDALGVAAGLHEYFRNSDIIQMANYAQTVNVIGCIKTTKTSAFFDATALPLLLYRREFGTLPLAVSGDYRARALDVSAAKTGDGKALTIGIVNPQAKPQAVEVAVEGMKLGASSTRWRIAGSDPAATNTPEKQNVDIVEEYRVPFDRRLTVPAYSVSLYRVPVQ